MSSALAVIPKPPEAEAAKLAPHNLELERAVLGVIMVHNDAFDRVADVLQPEHFYEGVHRKVFEVATTLLRAGKIASPITLKMFLGDVDFSGLTASQYLARLAAEATTVINAVEYARTIRDLALRRNLILVGEEISHHAFDSPPDVTPRHQIEDAERKLYALAESGKFEGGFLRFDDALKIAVDVAARAHQREGHLSGMATGLSDLDRMMGGLQRSDLVILAGRPGMGKTALVTNIAFNVAKAYRAEVSPDGKRDALDGGIVGFFSLEMSAEQLATRILAEQSGIPSYKIRRGDLQQYEFEKVVAASQQMQSVPLYIDQTGGISIAQLAARARRLKRQRGLDVLVVDYLQLLTGASKKGENRVQELTEITTGLKALAKELDVPVVALSQLSRQVENRDDKRPQLSDLRESGSIEQDADVVMFVYREEYYLKNKQPKEGTEEFLKWQAEMERAYGKAEVIIGKQRHGPTGMVELQFDAEITRFGNLAQTDRIPDQF